MGEGNGSALVGRVVEALFLEPGEARLAFACSDGEAVVWTANGDCCSETWFADIVGVRGLLGAAVVSVEAVDMASIGYVADEARMRQDHDQVYGYKIATASGICDVVFRNSSNGYYGGWTSESVEDGLPGQRGEWGKIEDDYGAPDECAAGVASWVSAKERRELAKVADAGKADARAKSI